MRDTPWPLNITIKFKHFTKSRAGYTSMGSHKQLQRIIGFNFGLKRLDQLLLYREDVVINLSGKG